MTLQDIISKVQPLDETAMEAARSRQNQLTKPPGSLGQLEAISIRMAGITGDAAPSIEYKVITTMAGDHGVVAEGVSAYPSEVTTQMVYNFLNGGAAINVLAQHIGARVVIVDMGVAADFGSHPDLIDKKIAPGSGNIARGPAMLRQQAIESIEAGIAVVEAELEKGLDILATGDMGIGNTTPSAAIAAALTGRAPKEIVGRGTGVDDEGLERKINAVQRALETNQPDADDAVDILAKIGGFEIGGLTGAILAAVAQRKPIVVDGFISTAAAMLAVKLAPQVREYLFSAHRSQERGHQIMLEWLELEPLLDLGLRLGEGTGAALAISLIEAACKILSDMATFSEAGVSDKE
ncbi:MAG: nicotinate-nucleotide--dimethylbenzimidazole phosphoribosyltransferase [Chloroflexota bacterium]|nr:nicotinate-nucleotide--dimethylbenzimidazole phosphoribosyltransferase [Chloroflexota bacterium]